MLLCIFLFFFLFSFFFFFSKGRKGKEKCPHRASREAPCRRRRHRPKAELGRQPRCPMSPPRIGMTPPRQRHRPLIESGGKGFHPHRCHRAAQTTGATNLATVAQPMGRRTTTAKGTTTMPQARVRAGDRGRPCHQGTADPPLLIT
jgi:hypothetical protein